MRTNYLDSFAFDREQPDRRIDPLFQPFLARSADAKSVKVAAVKIVEFAKLNPKTRTQIGDICRRIIAANRLPEYGSPAAQEYLKQWAIEFTASPAESTPEMSDAAKPDDERE